MAQGGLLIAGICTEETSDTAPVTWGISTCKVYVLPLVCSPFQETQRLAYSQERPFTNLDDTNQGGIQHKAEVYTSLERNVSEIPII